MPIELSPKQIEFLLNSNRHWNLAHGSVRTGKTVGSLFTFMHAVDACPDSDIWMAGHTSDTIYQNVIRLLFECPQLSVFRPFCTWFPGKRQLRFKDKVIGTLGAKDDGAIGNFQGKTFSLFYGDEMTLFPDAIIDMIDTRLSKPWSKGFASMNPAQPTHKLKQWIDLAEGGDANYYSLHFTINDNPFLDREYYDRVKSSLSGLSYKRLYLGLWCMAEGAIFDFFDKNIHVQSRCSGNTQYWIAGIDYGSSNAFACLLIRVNRPEVEGAGTGFWVEKEYYWDHKKRERQKTNSELARDVIEFLEPYAIRAIYIDPSAEAFHVELKRSGVHVVHAKNEVAYGIQIMTSEMAKGNLTVSDRCSNLIREIEGYVWDPKASLRGLDEPLKQNDHAIDALRYAVASHKIIKKPDDPNYGKTLGFR